MSQCGQSPRDMLRTKLHIVAGPQEVVWLSSRAQKSSSQNQPLVASRIQL